MKKQLFFLSIIISIIIVSCTVNQQLPLKKVDPPVYKDRELVISPIRPNSTKCKDTLSYIKSDIQRNLMLSLILRYPFEDVFYSKEYVDPFTTSKRPFSRFHNYNIKRYKYFSEQKRKEIRYYKQYDKERIIHDMLKFMIPANYNLLMTIGKVNCLDTTNIYGISCKDTLRQFCSISSEGPFVFYSISTDFWFYYNKTYDSLFPNSYYGSGYYKPFSHLSYGSNDSSKSLKKSRYLIAFNRNFITHSKSGSYSRHGCSKEILYLSKEFLKYEESVYYLRRIMQGHFNPDDPNTYVPYLRILAYSDYAGGGFVFINKNRRRLKYKFYSAALKSYMQATITIAYPQSVTFKLLKK